MDINFRGCFISCVFVYLPKYVAMETMRFSSVIRGHHIYRKYGKQPVWKGKQQHVQPFCCFYNEWWWNCGTHATMDFRNDGENDGLMCRYIAT